MEVILRCPSVRSATIPAINHSTNTLKPNKPQFKANCVERTQIRSFAPCRFLKPLGLGSQIRHMETHRQGLSLGGFQDFKIPPNPQKRERLQPTSFFDPEISGSFAPCRFLKPLGPGFRNPVQINRFDDKTDDENFENNRGLMIKTNKEVMKIFTTKSNFLPPSRNFYHQGDENSNSNNAASCCRTRFMSHINTKFERKCKQWGQISLTVLFRYSQVMKRNNDFHYKTALSLPISVPDSKLTNSG